MRNALAIALFPFLFVIAAPALAQTAWTGWDTPAGSRPGREGLTTPVVKSLAIPAGFFENVPGVLPQTVEFSATIETDGTVTPYSVKRSLGGKKGGLDDQAKAIVKSWRFEPGLLNGKPARVSVILSVPVGRGVEPLKCGDSIPALREWTKGLRSPCQPGVTVPVRLMGQTAGYPDFIIAQRQTGQVQVAAEILPDGHIGRVALLQSMSRAADEGAIAAIRQWFYIPAMADGAPVASYTVVTMNYDIR